MYLKVKRIIEFLISMISIVILAPFFLFMILLIKIDSPGPAFFKQERIGKDGKVFQIIKFRTMCVGAENTGDGIIVKSGKDERITRVGGFLRKTSLDELPQLFNIIKGDMGLIGPRPPVKYHPYNTYENYPDWAKKRFEIRPGATGWAQCTVRNSVSWDERIKLDNWYVENMSLLIDMKIFIKTINKLLFPSDIYKK